MVGYDGFIAYQKSLGDSAKKNGGTACRTSFLLIWAAAFANVFGSVTSGNRDQQQWLDQGV
jgi:hypothetical protein